MIKDMYSIYSNPTFRISEDVYILIGESFGAGSSSASDSMNLDRHELLQQCFMAILESDIRDVGLRHYHRRLNKRRQHKTKKRNPRSNGTLLISFPPAPGRYQCLPSQ